MDWVTLIDENKINCFGVIFQEKGGYIIYEKVKGYN